jgi:hypothetical protein
MGVTLQSQFGDVTKRDESRKEIGRIAGGKEATGEEGHALVICTGIGVKQSRCFVLKEYSVAHIKHTLFRSHSHGWVSLEEWWVLTEQDVTCGGKS